MGIGRVRAAALLLAVLSLLLAIGLVSPATAQVAAGYSEYYIPGGEDEMSLALRSLGPTPASVNMHALISITAWSDSVTIYYDHWENGILQFDPGNPSGDEVFTLATTGTVLNLDNTPAGGIPIPRDPAETYYDGGDRMYVVGGTVTVTRSSWREGEGRAVQAVAWEIYPVKPQLTTYILPFGENLGATMPDFERTFVLVQATADGTTFTVDLDGDGSAETLDRNFDGDTTDAGVDTAVVTLDAGESFFIGNVAVNPDPMPRGARATVNSGAVIQGSSTLQVKFVVGDPDANYETRGLSAFPRGYWTRDYYAPADEPTNATVTDIFLYNPHAGAITVDWETQTARGSFTIDAGATVSYRAQVGSLPQAGGVYLHGTDVFWGVSTIDSTGQVNEWAYSLLPTTFLYSEHFLGWAYGGTDGNDSGVFLTVVQDNTRVYVDTDNDGASEQDYLLDRLQTQYITDNTDGDLSGAHFWATGPFTMAFGQNPDTAPAQAASGDLGYVAIPGTDFISLVLSVDKALNPAIVPAAGGTSRVTLTVSSAKYTVDGISVVDTLPAGCSFVNNSATVTFPDLSTVSGSAVNPTISGGGLVLTWPSSLLGNMAENQRIEISFTASIPPLATGTLNRNLVKAVGTRTVGGVTQTFTTTDFAYWAAGSVGITKESGAADPVSPGDTIPYTVIASNTGSTPLTGVTLYDALPAGISYVAGSGSVTCTSTRNVRDEFATAAYSNNGPNNTADWAGDWTENDTLGGGATGGSVQVAANQLRFKLTDNYRDQFGTVAYTNSNGSTVWTASPWSETNDSQDQTTGDAAGGVVRITGGALQMRNYRTVADNFSTAVYTRNDGTTDWGGAWTEADSGGNGATGGRIYVDGGNTRLVLGNRDAVNNYGQYIYRGINLTGTGATGNAVLTFTYATSGNLEATDNIVVQYRTGGSGAWTTLATYADDVTGNASLTIPLASPANLTEIRFAFPDNGDYAAGNENERFYVSALVLTYNASPPAIQRTAAIGGATGATLNFTYASAGLVAGDTLVVEVASSAGGTYTTLATFTGGIPDSAPPYTIGAANISSTTTIRFRITGGFAATGKTISFDNVDITYTGATAEIQRTVDLTGASSATLGFSYAGAGLAGVDTFVVEAATSAGGTFTTLATFTSGTPDVAPPYTIGAANISSTTTIRFRITGGFATTAKSISVDNVDITYVAPVTFASDDPPNFLSSSDGCMLPPDGSVTLSFSATADDPFPAGVTEIVNTASTTSAELPIAIFASDSNLVLVPSAISASVGGRVWLDADGGADQDIGEPGIANVEVTLKDRFGTPLATTLTDGNGRFLFTDVPAGAGYYVEITDGLPAGLSQTFPVGRSDDRTGDFPLADGEVYGSAFLGYRTEAGTAGFGDQVWIDADGDGIFDAGEIGLAGVTLTLYRDDGNGLFDPLLDTVVATTTSAPDGTYLFTGATATGTEDYFVAATTPSGYSATNATVHQFIDVATGGTYLTADVGFRSVSTTYGIRDAVWLDADGDRAFDTDESGIAGVTVELLDASGNVIATVVTAPDGTFSFSGLPGGGADYTVRLNDTSGLLTDLYGTTSWARDLARAESNLTAGIDHVSPGPPSFGFRPTRSIGDTVFKDGDGDGIQDAGEAGIAGVIMRLYEDLDEDGLIDGTDPLLGTLATNASGGYLFSGLPIGTYIVSMPVVPAGYTFRGPGSDSDPSSDGIQKLSVLDPVLSTSDLTVDFGLQPDDPRSLSGRVWEDKDGDGVVDTGETGFAGVTVDVLSGTTVVATVTTDSSGNYSVAGLAPGTYTVRITDLSGVLRGYLPTYEGTGGASGTLDGEEPADLTSANLAGLRFGFRKPTPTYAAVASFGARIAGDAVVVEWRTSLEAGTIGFHLLRQDPATGGLVRVNAGLLPGLLSKPEGGVYTYRDASAPLGVPLTYALVEVDLRGEELTYGPWRVTPAAAPATGGTAARDAEVARRGYVRGPVAPPRDAGGRRGSPAGERASWLAATGPTKGTMLKIATSEAGLHRIPCGTIADLLGLPLHVARLMIARGQLSLTNRGRAVAYLPSAAGDAVTFYAEPVDSPYTGENVYWLAPAAGRIATRVGRGSGGTAVASFPDTVHLEEDVMPLPVLFTDPEADFWAWDYLFAGATGHDALALTVPAPGAAGAGTASLTLGFFGGTDAKSPLDHHVLVRWNGSVVGEVRWDGVTTKQAVIPLDGALVNPGDNALELVGLLDRGVDFSVVYVDSIDLTYQRSYVADGGRLDFEVPPASAVTVGGFPSRNVVLLDVTTAATPRVQGFALSGPLADGTFRIAFSTPASGGTRRFHAGLSGAIAAPASVTARRPGSLRLRSQAADYVLVAPGFLVEAASALAAYRNGTGIVTKVVALEEVYDEFGAGIASPVAVRDFLRYAAQSWRVPPRFATLVGRGTYDFMDRLGAGDNLVPTFLVSTPRGLVVSDLPTADLGIVPGVPAIALGRLPVTTSGELLDYLAKIRAHEAAGPPARVLMAADNRDSGGDFPATSAAVSGLIPAGYRIDRINLTGGSAAAAKAALIGALNEGATVFNYIGHGGLDRLAGENLLGRDDIPSLAAGGRLPLFVAITCSVGNFGIPAYRSLGELMLLAPSGGAFATVAASGLSEGETADLFDWALFRAIFDDDGTAVGDVVRESFGIYDGLGGPTHVKALYNLLGEPVGRLP